MITDQLKLECLKVAASVEKDRKRLINLAKEMYAFVSGPAPEPIEEPAQPDGGSIDTGVTDGLPPAPVDQPQPQAG